MLKAELIRYWADLRFYRQLLLGNLLTAILVTGGIFYLVTLLGEASISALAALILWQYASIPLSRISADIWEESTSGAFEQMYLHARQPVLVLLVRMGIYAVQHTVYAIPLFLVLAAVFALPWSALVGYPWLGLLGILILTLLGLSGLGLLVGAVLLVYRNAISYTSALEYVLLFVSGAVIPLAQLPGPIAAVAPWLPLTLGIESLRRLEAGGDVSAMVLLLALQSVVLLLVGLVAFQVALRRALRRGFAMST
ncbi:ABC transporter permease [uncultured Meiothermus sp.]|uniref:ABC transporter permease n=1 Tax=uncultured Meiothermus sp. TaxID=157471 RepID=UPI0026025113|nr:ABC transporter permease [uncultured Meiothermus sp.]